MAAHPPPAEAAASSASDASFSTVALLDVGLVRHFLELGDDGSLTRDTVVDVSSDGQRVGCARKSRLLVLQPLADISLPPTQLSLPGDEVRCLQWAELQALPPHLAALLLVGGASGRLRAYTPAGALVWSAWPHASPLVRLRLHTSGAVAADLSCVYAGGIMAHVPAALLAEKIAAAAATEAEAPEAEGGGGADDFAVCELEGAAAAHDAVCAGELPPLPLDVSDPRRAAEQQPLVFLLATGGAQSALQLHLFDANGARIDARRAVVAAGRAAVGVLSGLASWGLGERAAGRLREGVGRVAAALPEAAPSAVREMSSCVRDWRDAPRVFNALALSPCRRWAAATDSLGRVLLLEARTLVVLRLWKGYRDAQVGWCGGGGGGLALAIYAPRRGLLELWRVPLGARLHACAVGADCVLLEAPPPLRPPPTASAAEHGPCFLLQPSGALSVLTAGAPHPE